MKVGSKRTMVTQAIYAECPTDKFEVRFGYKDRSSVQIRLQENQDTGEPEIYASVFPEHISYGAHIATVPFKMFVDKFREFLDHLAAYHHHVTEEQKTAEA